MNNKALKLYQRLYQIEELVGSIFVRISKSEIINLNYIDHLKLETNGMVHLTEKIIPRCSKRCVHWSYDFCHYFTYFFQGINMYHYIQILLWVKFIMKTLMKRLLC
ncbi:LytTR family DNA-binding domain-containing protein [Staphylococcus aureus]